jgi:hypothetical protein
LGTLELRPEWSLEWQEQSATGIQLFIWQMPIAKQTFVCQWLLSNMTHSSSHHPSLPPTFIALCHCHHHSSPHTIAHPAPPYHQPPPPITFIDHQQRQQHMNNTATPFHHQMSASKVDVSSDGGPTQQMTTMRKRGHDNHTTTMTMAIRRATLLLVWQPNPAPMNGNRHPQMKNHNATMTTIPLHDTTMRLQLNTHHHHP